jgi:hypothetical protein
LTALRCEASGRFRVRQLIPSAVAQDPGCMVYNEAFKMRWSALGAKTFGKGSLWTCESRALFQGEDDQKVVNFEQILFANGCMLDLTEAPAQRGRAFNSTLWPEPIRVSVALAPKHVERKEIIMQVPSMLQGESLKRLLQGAAAGAVVTMFVGFYWGGWSLGSTADKMAKERSELAVVAVLAPVCADKFRALPDADAKKVALSKVESWKRRDEFPKEFVTLPGESYPSSALVDACYTLLFAPKSAALK